MQDRNTSRRLVLLATAAVFINYIDRGNLATAAPLIQEQLHLSASQLGFLLSAFYYGYVACMPAAGWLAERYGVRRVFATGLAIWSIATLATGFAQGFLALLILRVLLGVGESVTFPCASKVLAGAVPVAHLGKANGVLAFGYLVGPAVGTLLGGILMSMYGWRPVFILFGALSLLWLWPWARTKMAVAPRQHETGGHETGAHETGDGETQRREVDPDGPPYRLILRQRALWGTSLGHFASNYSFYFILSWLPFYLVKARGFSMETMAVTASWSYLLNAVSALLMGWAADRWVRSGRSTDLIYKGVMAMTHVVGIACMAGMVLLPVTGSIIALFILQIFVGFSSPGIFAIPQIIAGPKASGSWVGIQNAVGNMAGLIAPVVTGILVDQTGRFDLAFAVVAAVNVLGLVGWLVILPKIVPIDWARAGANRFSRAI
ncbi:MAG: MFS transporter [Xanthomonadales bacterium]|nr:MFS transporter [Xanthomonadales bacterium]